MNTSCMTTEVIVTANFETWWDGLGVEEQKSVAVVVAMLEERGATPLVSGSFVWGSVSAVLSMVSERSGVSTI
jgi:hypothetical protein